MTESRIPQQKRALELCAALISVLFDVGPSRCEGQCVTDTSLSESHALDRALDESLQTISRIRNHTVSVASRLPPDILSYIFSIPFNEDWLLASAPDYAKVLSRVSHHWRRVALATPALWATIFIGGHYCCRFDLCDDIHRGTSRRAKEFLIPRRIGWSSEWLARAKAVPLTITIGHDMEDEAAHLIDAMTQTTWIVPPAVRRIYWSPSSSKMKKLLVRLLALCRGTVQILDVSNGSAKSQLTSTDSDLVLGVAMPSLRIIDIRGASLPSSFAGLSACRTLLLSVDVSSYASQIVPLLHSCTELEELEIEPSTHTRRLQGAFNVGRQGRRKIVLPRLRVFRLNEGRAEPNGLMSVLQAPNLQALELRNPRENPDTLRNFLMQSPSLQSLTFAEQPPRDLLPILLCAQELQSLHFKEIPIDFDQQLKVLYVEADDAWVACRHLTFLSLHVKWHGLDVARRLAEALAAIARSRRGHALIADIQQFELSHTYEEGRYEYQIVGPEVETLVFNGETFDKHEKLWRPNAN